MIMLKDNHVWSSGSITAAVQRARKVGGFALKIEVECQSQEEAEEAITAGADIVMLDNFPPAKLKVAAKNLKAQFPKVIVEASGGVTVENVSDYFDENVDVVSMGLLTQSVPHIDFSLKIVPKAN
jgi:nicotinate-nucleotide pyrophosphorylase (carboxylating)